METYAIPRYLDEPERWMFWTIDEALVMMGPAATGLMTGFLLYGTIIGVCGFLVMRRLKGNGQANIGLFALYWFLPNVFNFKATPHSDVRRFV